MARKTRTAERKKEREQSRQRNQQVYIIGAIVVVAVIAALIFALNNIPADVEIPEYANRTELYRTGTTAEGYPILGNPNAPVEVKEFASFACSGCLTFHETVFPQLLQPIAQGQIKFVFVPLTTGSVPNPEGANRTALCAGQQGKFWQMHDVLFSWQSVYGNSAFQDQRLRSGIAELGLDGGTFNSCFRTEAITNTLASAQAEGVTTTPTIWVNNAPVGADFESIMTAVSSNLTASSYESGLLDTTTDGTSNEATVEPVVTEAVVTEEATTAPEEEATAEVTAEATAAGE